MKLSLSETVGGTQHPLLEGLNNYKIYVVDTENLSGPSFINAEMLQETMRESIKNCIDKQN